ncbi:MAG TPA: hypothetical protein VNJ70_14065 [Thermoanaerobaculia bacterium]|nr:hypothetical protein [Thermoanaerobaculia bacterium]
MAHLTHNDALFVLAPLPRAERRRLAHALVCDACRAVLREVLAAQTPAASPEQPASRRSRPLDYSATWTALEKKLAAEVPGIFVARVPITLIAELTSQAWALVGNARRHRRDLPGADWAFQQAQAKLDLATDLAVNATFCRLLSELRREQGRTEEALALGERARVLFTQVHKLADSTSGPDIPPGAGSQET